MQLCKEEKVKMEIFLKCFCAYKKQLFTDVFLVGFFLCFFKAISSFCRTLSFCFTFKIFLVYRLFHWICQFDGW